MSRTQAGKPLAIRQVVVALGFVGVIATGAVTWHSTTARVDALADAFARLERAQADHAARIDALREAVAALKTETAVSAEARKAVVAEVQELTRAVRDLSRTPRAGRADRLR